MRSARRRSCAIPPTMPGIASRPWLGHLMVSRQETARPLLTPGEIMQLPPRREIVMVAGTPPDPRDQGPLLCRGCAASGTHPAAARSTQAVREDGKHRHQTTGRAALLRPRPATDPRRHVRRRSCQCRHPPRAGACPSMRKSSRRHRRHRRSSTFSTTSPTSTPPRPAPCVSGCAWSRGRHRSTPMTASTFEKDQQA
jgi:hypothetical protein